MTIKRKANGHADVGGWRHAFLVTLGLLAVSLATLPAQGPTSADFPSNLPRADQDRLRREALEAFEQQFLPAWRKLRTYMAQTYLPRVRPADSIASMKDGRAAYTILIHRLTTTRLSGADIHRLGEQEVARIEGEMQAIARNAGFTGSVADFQKKLDADPTQHFRSKEEMLANSRNIAMIIMPELPNQFRRIPALLFGVRPIAPDRESASATNAQAGAPDLSSAGWAARTGLRHHLASASIVRLDRSLDDLRLLLQKRRHLCPYEVGRESHRFVGARLVLEDAEGRALASPRVQPVVADETLSLADDRHELVLDEPIDLGAVLLVEMVVTDDTKHAPSYS